VPKQQRSTSTFLPIFVPLSRLFRWQISTEIGVTHFDWGKENNSNDDGLIRLTSSSIRRLLVIVSLGDVWTIDGSLLLLNLLDLLFYANKISAGQVDLYASSVLQDNVLIPFPLKITRAKHGNFFRQKL
jgi:hypothetical protein